MRQREQRERERERERAERKKNEIRENKIKDFRNKQDIGLFLDLLSVFKYEKCYLEKTIESLNEDTIIDKFGKIKDSYSENIQIINETLFEPKDNMSKISDNCIRKLILLLLFNEKESDKRDAVFRNIYDLNKYKYLLFDILLYFNEYFGQDIKFENQDIYKEFVVYSIKEGKYLRSLSYLRGIYRQNF